MINRSGFFYDVAAADYHADPCERPSFTQSIGKILLEKSPLHAWYAHPKLNPDHRLDDDQKYDIGNLTHRMLIGRGRDIEIIPGFDDWRKKEAQERRVAATAAGKIGVLAKQALQAERMTLAAIEQLTMRGLGDLFREHKGSGEAVIVWKEGELYFRQMIDWLSLDRRTFVDLKTTSMSVAPHCLDRMMATAGWPIQAAMAERGLDVLDPDNAGRRRFLFIVQEDFRPFALSVVELTEGPMTMGRKQLDHAVGIWRRCIESDRWPGYPTEIVTPQYPGWAETQWLDREIEHEHRRRTVVWDDEVRGTSGRPILTDLAGG